MFGSIFKEVTSYFDRHALVSAFTPTLVLWAIVIGLSLFLSGHWRSTFDWLKGAEKDTAVSRTSTINVPPNMTITSDPNETNKKSEQVKGASLTEQILLFLSFLTCVIFTSFLVLNFHVSLVRLYSGYVSNIRLLTPLLERRRETWRQRFRENTQLLRKLRDQTRTLEDVIESKWCLPTGLEPPSPSIDLHKKYYLILFRFQYFRYFYRFGQIPVDDIAWGYYIAKNYGVSKAERTISLLIREAKRRKVTIQHQMQRLDRDRFFLFPLEEEDVMPTHLGNTIRAAETYPKDHYHLSASLIWTWLEPLLPKESSGPLNDARTSLDLMITCSSLIILVGLPFSVWAGVKYAGSWFWWTPLIPAILIFLFRFFNPLWIVIVLLVLVELIFQLLHRATLLSDLHVLLTLLSGVILLAWICYQSAVQASFSYGERYRVAFDQHRWKILEALHLQLPRDFEEECRMWERVGKMLYRASQPAPYYWTYTKQPNTKAPMPPIPPSQLRRPVPLINLKPGMIMPNKQEEIAQLFRERAIEPDEIWIDAVQEMGEIAGKKTHQWLLENQLIPRVALGERLSTIAVGIPATTAMLLGGKVKQGDIIDLILIPARTENRFWTEPVLFNDLEVLEIKQSQWVDEIPPEPRYVLVIALPVERRFEFAAKSDGATFLLTMKSAMLESET